MFLDNEKAFDRVQHDFMFETLRAFHLPEVFVRAVQILYKAATTSAKLNGARKDGRSATRLASDRDAPSARSCIYLCRRSR